MIFFNDAAKCILIFEAPSRVRKGWITSIKTFNRKQKISKYSVNKIRRFVNWCFDVTNKILFWTTNQM